MLRKINAGLSPLKCKSLGPGLHADGGNLYLQVRERKDGGLSKSWILRYTSPAGKARDMGLGPFPDVGLADARERARQARLQLLDGNDPLEERRSARVEAVREAARRKTFKQVAEEYIDSHSASWKGGGKSEDQWEASLRDYAYPTLGELPAGEIDDEHILAVLKPIWESKTVTADRVRNRIEAILDFAGAMRLREGENPARWRGHLSHLLPAKTKVREVKHHAALPYTKLPQFMAKLRKVDTSPARALEWTILTAVRTGDVLGAEWSEIDVKHKQWTIPAHRLKGKRGQDRKDHVVPLSTRALAILKELPRAGDRIFPTLNKMSMPTVLARLAAGTTVHGFRSAFRDWAAERTNFPSEVAEMALAHAVSSAVERAYRRGDLREKRRALNDDWAKYCSAE